MSVEKRVLTIDELKKTLLDDEALSGLAEELIGLFEKYVDLRLRSILYKPKEEEKHVKVVEAEKPEGTVKKTFKGKELKGPITLGQLNFLKSLYKQLGREPPTDIEKWSKATASAMIDELLKIRGRGD